MADTTLGTVQILGLIDAQPVDGTEFLVVSQGTAARKVTILNAIKPHTTNMNNPHQVTKAQVGLGNVSNDAQLKVASNLGDVADKISARANLVVYSTAEADAKLAVHTSNINNPHQVTKAQVGLSNVPNKASSDSYVTLTDTLATTKAVNDLYKAIQNQNPVGSILISANAANPSTYMLCGGTWELTAKNMALVGYDGVSITRTVGSTFGVADKKILTENLPQHSHGVTITSQPHAHGVVGSTQGGGSHSHPFSGSTSTFDYGSRAAVTDAQGVHTHHGYTNAGGNHRHTFGGDDQLDNFNEIAQARAGRYDADSDNDVWANFYWTGYSGDHSHEFYTDAGGNHAHNVTINIGGHSHTFAGNTNAVSDHLHNISFASQSATVSVVGDTQTTGGNVSFNIEQPSVVYYVWRRTS